VEKRGGGTRKSKRKWEKADGVKFHRHFSQIKSVDLLNNNKRKRYIKNGNTTDEGGITSLSLAGRNETRDSTQVGQPHGEGESLRIFDGEWES